MRFRAVLYAAKVGPMRLLLWQFSRPCIAGSTMEAPSNGAAADGDAVMTDAQQSSTALQNEYESIPDADLDAAERKVLEMLELSAKIAEDLAGGLEPAPQPAASVASDATRFMALAGELRRTLEAARFPPELEYRRTAGGEIFRRRLDEMHDAACDDLHHELRAHAQSALRDSGAGAAGGDAAAALAALEPAIKECEDTALAAGVRR